MDKNPEELDARGWPIVTTTERLQAQCVKRRRKYIDVLKRLQEYAKANPNDIYADMLVVNEIDEFRASTVGLI